MFNKIKNWHSGLSKIGKVFLWSATVVLVGGAISSAAGPTPTPSSSGNASTHQEEQKKPEITTKTLTETSNIDFEKKTVDDPNLESGKTKVTTVGVNGVKTTTYEITLEDGQEKSRKATKEETTTNPVAEVTAKGTKVAVATPAPAKPKVTTKPKSNCDPNYSGACVPIASDVDCAGGGGNGPAYTYGPVYVIGSDIYKLDNDHDGIGCE